ncbi:MAG: hypothetical protein ACLFTK_02470 [Anaerolineales bacterium]
MISSAPAGHEPELPHLRLVPVDALTPHEEHDPQRSAPLVKRIADSGIWLNPPIVAPFDLQRPDAGYIILDGANRYHCVRQLGYPHILVQVVDYDGPNVRLETWDHVLSNIEIEALIPRLHEIEGVMAQDASQSDAETALDLGAALAYIRVLPDRITLLISDDDSVTARTQRLRQLVDIYKNIAKIDRFNGDNPQAVLQMHPDAAAVVVFPLYTPDEIMQAAHQGVFLPPGISRHIINGRAMRLLYPLDELRRTDKALDDKNQDLLNWIQQRVAQKAVRLYAEATYIFDE